MVVIEEKKKELINVMKKYVDEDGCIDISRFRVENPEKYSLLPHYYGTIKNAIDENGWVKVMVKHNNKKQLSLKDQLALYTLDTMKRDKTYEMIGKQFGNVSKAAVSQLHKVLQNASKSKQ